MAPVEERLNSVSVIVPARNEEMVIAACVESLAAQKEVAEIVVVDDHSTDRTAEIVREMGEKYQNVRLLRARELPAGWVGKNNAVWMGECETTGGWLLFTDADAIHERDSVNRALEIAVQRKVALVSFSPGQVMETWYEKALIPYVYLRLSGHFSFDEVNDPMSAAAAANGQFLMIRRDAYEAVGGHASVSGEVLEDVALAKQAKKAGYAIWFGSGRGIVRVRMYRSFDAMWEGWRKNLFRLMGGSPGSLAQEILMAILPGAASLIAAVAVGVFAKSWPAGMCVFVAGIVAMLVLYAQELRKAQFPGGLAWYGWLGRLLYAAVLWASYRSHKTGRLEWKGRTYPASPPGASNKEQK
jgi:glycosyltransferase involved in cell wall biosynthesis